MSTHCDPQEIPSDWQWEHLWNGRFPVYFVGSTSLYLGLLFNFYTQENQIGGAAIGLLFLIHRALDVAYIFKMYLDNRAEMLRNPIPDSNEVVRLLNKNTPIFGLGGMVIVQIIVMMFTAHFCSQLAHAALILPPLESPTPILATETPHPTRLAFATATPRATPSATRPPTATPRASSTPSRPRTITETISFANLEQAAALLAKNPDRLKSSVVWFGDQARHEVAFQTARLLEAAGGMTQVTSSFVIVTSTPRSDGSLVVTTTEHWHYCISASQLGSSSALYTIEEVYHETYVLEPVAQGYVIAHWMIMANDGAQAMNGCP